MHLGHAPGKLGWGLARVPARKALVESAADVANERLVRVDIAEAPGQPAAVSVSVAQPALEPSFAPSPSNLRATTCRVKREISSI